MKKVIPSGITTLSLLFGIAALWQYIYGEISTGLFLNLVCVILDGLDGYYARKFNACTMFGKKYDLIVDFCVFGLFLEAIPIKLYGADAWTCIVMILFIGSHTARVIINLQKVHSKYHGMPDTLIPIVIAVIYFTVETKLNILFHFTMCAIYMHLWFRYPRLDEYRRIRTHKDVTVIQALCVLYLMCMFGLDWKSISKDDSLNEIF